MKSKQQVAKRQTILLLVPREQHRTTKVQHQVAKPPVHQKAKSVLPKSQELQTVPSSAQQQPVQHQTIPESKSLVQEHQRVRLKRVQH